MYKTHTAEGDYITPDMMVLERFLLNDPNKVPPWLEGNPLAKQAYADQQQPPAEGSPAEEIPAVPTGPIEKPIIAPDATTPQARAAAEEATGKLIALALQEGQEEKPKGLPGFLSDPKDILKAELISQARRRSGIL